MNSKYYNKRVIVDGHTFDSKREARRYQELKMLANSRIITDLRLQPKFELIPSQRRSDGKPERPVVYIADFSYKDRNGNTVIEDAKGVRTAEYKIKRKLMLQKYGITVREV